MSVRIYYASDDAMTWENIVVCVANHFEENPGAAIISLSIDGYGKSFSYRLQLEPQ